MGKKQSVNDENMKTSDDWWPKQMLWANEDDISKIVHNYEQMPWHTKPKAILACVLSFFFFIGLFINFSQALFALIYFVPLIYLLLSGYRIASILIALLYTIDRIYVIKENYYLNVYIIFFVWCLIIGLCITCFRVETGLKKNGTAKNAAPIKDTFIAIMSGIILLCCWYVLIFSMDDAARSKIARENLASNFKIVFVKMNSQEKEALLDLMEINVKQTAVLASVCAENGYEMQNYPYVFQTLFKTQLEIPRKIFEKRGLSFDEGINEYFENWGEWYSASMYDELEDWRKGLILLSVSDQLGIPVENLEWSESYNHYISLAQTCAMIDEHAQDLFSDDIQMKELLDKAVETLKANPDLF